MAFQNTHKPRRVAILVLSQTNMLALASAVDPLRAANRHARRTLYDWQFVTPDAAPVTLTSGVTLPGQPIVDVPDCDLLVVVASFDAQKQTSPKLCASLRRLSRGAVVAGIDGGPWVLAQAGLLDQHRATVHWEDLDAFSQRYPAVHVINARHIASKTRLTCGGAAPALDMMLDLIAAQHGSDLSGRVAASLIHMPARPESPQHRTGPSLSHNAVTAKAQAMMEAHIDAPLPLSVLAKRLGLGPRALQQHFRMRLGTTPQAHYLSLRLAEAHRLVTQTDMPLQDVADTTGFSSPASFSRAFRTAFATSASNLRV